MQSTTETRGSLKVEWLGPTRGFGVICQEAKSLGDVLFVESPAALFQPNRSLVSTCSSPHCMRVIGSVESLVDRSHAFYRSVAQVSTVRLEGEKSDRVRKSQLLQQIMQVLPEDKRIIPCRATKLQAKEDACSHVYCSAECEEFSWLHGHKFLCESSNPLLIPFFQSRNIARNPDAQIAAHILAQFIATVESISTSSSSSSSPASVADQWKHVTNFHAAPWSTVLAAQAIFAQQQVPDFQQIMQAHAEHMNKSDASATGVNVTPASESSSPAMSASAQTALQQLNSTQVQYRAALKEGFNLLHDALSRAHSSSPTSASWLPYINLENFDRLAGANRLNNTQTQTVLPVPTLPQSLQQLTQSLQTSSDSLPSAVESLNLLTANEDTVAEATAVSSSSSSSDPALPFLFSSLLSLFSPMSLPRADAKALLPFHSKMNHSCAPNARVENWLDDSNVAFTSKSMEIVQQQQEDKSQMEEALSHGNKKKKQKNKLKKAAAAAEAQKKEKRDLEILEKIAAHFQQQQQQQPQPLNTEATSSSGSNAAEPDLRSASTCTIVVRAIRPIAAGDEVCISYTPSTAAFRNKSVRKDYLQKQYLFTCSCALCADK